MIWFYALCDLSLQPKTERNILGRDYGMNLKT